MRCTPRRFRLTVLSGFLGAGKTTWLRHHLRSGVFRDAILIVNEAANAAADHLLLGAADGVHVLAGGCACCAGLPKLLRLLRDLLVSGPAAESSAVQRIVLETSGLSDPLVIREAIESDPSLSACVEVSEIVVIIDAVKRSRSASKRTPGQSTGRIGRLHHRQQDRHGRSVRRGAASCRFASAKPGRGPLRRGSRR